MTISVVNMSMVKKKSIFQIYSNFGLCKATEESINVTNVRET